jgi:hypothetical protein
VTRGAGLASHGFCAVGAERNRKQQGVYEAQQVECITRVAISPLTGLSSSSGNIAAFAEHATEKGES